MLTTLSPPWRMPSAMEALTSPVSPAMMIMYLPGHTVEERMSSTWAAFTIKSLVSMPRAILVSSTMPMAFAIPFIPPSGRAWRPPE